LKQKGRAKLDVHAGAGFLFFPSPHIDLRFLYIALVFVGCEMQQQLQMSGTKTLDGRKKEPRLNVRLQNGAQFSPRAVAGLTIMDLIKADGFPINPACCCGGGCANCHIKVSAPWRSLLPPPSNEERERLRQLPGADERSRLACQLRMTADLDGLAIELQPESLAVQTYWVAG
jgi:2Fe-2S ferredoxin